MGLDMYLEARRNLWSFYEDDMRKADLVASVFPELDDIGKIDSVGVELMYWRKANAIHKWFVDNVQDGRDECQRTFVEREKLQHLYNIIEQVLKDNTIETAKDLLPTESGFFFGGTDYDRLYWESLEETKQKLEKILAMDLDKWDIYYQSSW